MANLSDPKAPPQLHELEAAGQQLRVKVTAVDVNVPDDLDRAFRTLADQRIEVIVVLQTSMLLSGAPEKSQHLPRQRGFPPSTVSGTCR